jgi:hypothetical protein
MGTIAYAVGSTVRDPRAGFRPTHICKEKVLSYFLTVVKAAAVNEAVQNLDKTPVHDANPIWDMIGF